TRLRRPRRSRARRRGGGGTWAILGRWRGRATYGARGFGGSPMGALGRRTRADCRWRSGRGGRRGVNGGWPLHHRPAAGGPPPHDAFASQGGFWAGLAILPVGGADGEVARAEGA